MSKSSSLRVPSYRPHKPTDQAVVTIKGRDIYLGKWNTTASKDEYDRLIAEFLANGRRLQSDADATLVEVLMTTKIFLIQESYPQDEHLPPLLYPELQ